MVLQAGTHRVLIWKQIPWLSAAEPPCKLNTMPRGGCKEGNCSQCSPVLKRCCSESGGGLHHHGLLQHAPNTCVWVESSLKPPRPWGTLRWFWWCIGDLVPICYYNLAFQQQLPASASPCDSAVPLFSTETFLGLPLYLFQNWFLFWLSVLSFFPHWLLVLPSLGIP